MEYQVHSEPHGGHWIAWITIENETKPAGSVMLVGKTKDEAEMNARSWGERLNYDPLLLR